MLLAIDVGNSTTAVGLFVDGRLTHRWRLSTVARRTPDEWALLLGGLLTGERLARREVAGTIVGSVVPPVTEALRATARAFGEVEPVIVEPGVRTGMPVRHDNPRDLGADRIANAVAAEAAYGSPTVVIDFGTAISFDVVDADGRFVGGAIAPGVSTALDAVVERAARLPTIELSTPDRAIGASTVEALRAGTVFGYAGLVDGVVERVVGELGPGVTTVATGGVADSVLDACRTIDHFDPALTLKGLAAIWERNAG